MAYTVGEVAELSGVSVRALHHYDQLGLVRPSGRSAAGYRLYAQADLERLQDVLFHRALGLPLDAIRRLLDDPGADRVALLRRQRQALVARIDGLAGTLALLDRTLRQLERGETTMSVKSMFEGFDPAAYEAEAEARWGDTDAWAESRRRTRGYTQEDWARAEAEGQAATERFARLMEAGVAPTDPATREAVEAHRAHIDRWFYPCSPTMQRALAEMYVADARFTATYDRVRPGLAGYIRDAILEHARG
ncbi:MAG: MerR family transcriptional regulator [Deltaproteobacteria bacterium]|nr:MerR family transcriptional regulator [Deltaproteobacteria bacterium]